MLAHAADAVDTSLMEAARVDGVGELVIFFTVALRLLMPGTVTVLLFALVATWNNYFLPLLMLNSAELFLPVGLAQWQATAAGGSGAQALFSTVITGSLLSIIPLVIASSSCSGTGSQACPPAASRPDLSLERTLPWTPPRQVLFGAAYYHEYQPPTGWTPTWT